MSLLDRRDCQDRRRLCLLLAQSLVATSTPRLLFFLFFLAQSLCRQEHVAFIDWKRRFRISCRWTSLCVSRGWSSGKSGIKGQRCQ